MGTTIQETKCFHHLEKISSNGIKFKQSGKDPMFFRKICLKDIPDILQSK